MLDPITRLTQHVVAIGKTGDLSGHLLMPRQIEGRLRQLEKAVGTMPLGLTITDLDGQIIYINRAGARMHGYQGDELLGQAAMMFTSPELRKPLTIDQMKGWKGLLRESLRIRQDGTTFPAWLMSEVVQDAEGEPFAIVTSYEDITERK
jgi:PAS domain S-box-containing protein